LLSPVKSFGPKDPISQVIGYLRDSNLYEAFVEEGESTTIATIRDLLSVQNITTTKISALTAHVPRLNPNNSASEAALIMFEHRVRSLPIYEKGKLVGQINVKSILRKMMDTDLNLKISRIMTPNPSCVHSSDNVSKARSIMIKRKIDQLPVLKDEVLSGVISSSTIVFNLLPHTDRAILGDWRQARFDVPVERLSSLNAVTSEASDSVNDAFQNMERNSSTYSIILNLDEVQGIVTHRDFMRILAQSRSPSETSMYIVGLPEEPFEAEVTKAKFTRIVKFMRNGIPDITEARAIIKTGESKAAKKRYQVRVFMMTPRRRLSYAASGYDLPEIFDEISSWAK
ncbi:MAG: CBS domain-containing protein, partial [Nitrososphaerales archaeon]